MRTRWREPKGGRSPSVAPAVALLAGLLLTSASAPANATAAQPAAQLALVGHTGGPVRAVVADDDRAWVGEGIGITRLDISNPQGARREGHTVLGFESDVYSLALAEPYLLAGTRGALHVLDVSDVETPTLTARLDTPGTVRAVTVLRRADAPTILLLSDDSAGVLWVELTADGQPIPRHSVPSDGGAPAPSAASGELALVPGRGVHVISVADPRAPVEIGRLPLERKVTGIAIVGELAYVSDASGMLHVISLSEPAVPEIIGGLAEVGAGPLFRHGEHLLLVDRGVRLIDISNPTQPIDVFGHAGRYAFLSGALDLALSGTRLLAARGHMLQTADIAAPTNPVALAEHRSVWPIQQLEPVGQTVYVATGPGGLPVVDVAAPERPSVELEWLPPWGTYGVLARGDRAFLSTERGMEQFDVTEPLAPRLIEPPLGPGWETTRWIAANDALLVATTIERLYIARRPDDDGPPQPVGQLSYADDPRWPANAVAQGVVLHDAPLAYVAAGAAGLAVVSLVESDRPRVQTMVRLPGDPEVLSLAIGDGQLAVGTRDGVALFELSTPFSPGFVGRDAGRYAALELSFGAGDRLYAAADLEGLVALDISDPAAPVRVGHVRPPYRVFGLDRSGDHVFVAGAGLLVLDTDPAPGVTPLPAPPDVPPPTPTRPPPVVTATYRPPTPSATATSALTATPSATTAPPTPVEATPTPPSVEHVVYLPRCQRYRDEGAWTQR